MCLGMHHVVYTIIYVSVVCEVLVCLSHITNIITSAGTTKAKIVPFSTDIQQLHKMAVTEVNSTRHYQVTIIFYLHKQFFLKADVSECANIMHLYTVLIIESYLAGSHGDTGWASLRSPTF